jgi:hypothetical protein
MIATADGKYIWAVEAVGAGHRYRREVLHTTYVDARTREGAERCGRYWLSIFIRGRRFSVEARYATPQELGCVPANPPPGDDAHKAKGVNK